MSSNHFKVHFSDYQLAEIKAGVNLREYSKAQGLSPLPNRTDRYACPWRSGADSDGFRIFPDGWKDYVTEESGDAIEFVRRLHGCDFNAAVEKLARFAGIEVPAYKKEVKASEAKKEKTVIDESKIMEKTEIRPDVKAVYKYCDAENKLVFEVLRLEPGRKGKTKEFRQRRPGKNGGWIYNLKDIKEKPLYRLPEWLKSDDEFIFLVEGEKDADNLFGLGLKATCNSSGAGKWKSNYAKLLNGKNVVIIPDNDTAGQKHTEKILPELLPEAASVRILELPGLPSKGDASDWIEQQKKDSKSDDEIRLELLKLARGCEEAAKDYVSVKAELLPSEPDMAAREESEEPEENISDSSLPIPKKEKRKERIMPKDIADAFMSENCMEGMPLYRIFRGMWYCYRNGIYVQLSRGDLNSAVMTFLRRRFPDSANISARNNVVANLEADDLGGIPSDTAFPCWLPEHTLASEWFGMGNCLLNVELAAAWLSGESVDPGEFIKEHTPKLFSTFKVNYNYDPNAKCPKFMKFIEEVQPDPAGRDVVAMMFGLMLIADCRYEVMFILFGRAGTGKSTALDILREVVGEQNTCCLTLDKISEKHSIHLVTEHSVNIVGDASYEAFATRALDEGLLKSMISGNAVPVEHKHKDPDDAPTIARFLIATNTLPPFADRTDGVWDRVRIIPFNQRFRNTPKQNPNLKYEIIKDELPGVFNWALKGLAMLRKIGHFPEHPEGLKLVAEHRLSCDHERQFLEDNYAELKGAYVLKSNLYDAYRRFCNENGFHPKNSSNFGLEVKRVFPEAKNERVRLETSQPRIWRNVTKIYL